MVRGKNFTADGASNEVEWSCSPSPGKVSEPAKPSQAAPQKPSDVTEQDWLGALVCRSRFFPTLGS